VGLSHTSGYGGRGDLDIVFSLPPIDNEKVLNFALVPTYMKADQGLLGNLRSRGDGDGVDESSTDDDVEEDAPLVAITPAVLLLTQVKGRSSLFLTITHYSLTLSLSHPPLTSYTPKHTQTPPTPHPPQHTQSQEEEGEDKGGEGGVSRHLKIVRCPAVSVTNWILEVGGISEPTLALEVLPAPVKATVREQGTGELGNWGQWTNTIKIFL
jgi:hypothetical protein